MTKEQLDVLTKEVNKTILEDWWGAGDGPIEIAKQMEEYADKHNIPLNGKFPITKSWLSRESED